MDDKDLKIAALKQGFTQRVGELESSSQEKIADLSVQLHKVYAQIQQLSAELETLRQEPEDEAEDSDGAN